MLCGEEGEGRKSATGIRASNDILAFTDTFLARACVSCARYGMVHVAGGADMQYHSVMLCAFLGCMIGLCFSSRVRGASRGGIFGDIGVLRPFFFGGGGVELMGFGWPAEALAW